MQLYFAKKVTTGLVWSSVVFLYMENYSKKSCFFYYNGNLNQLDDFSSSSSINVMIISLKEVGRSRDARNRYGSLYQNIINS